MSCEAKACCGLLICTVGEDDGMLGLLGLYVSEALFGWFCIEFGVEFELGQQNHD